MRIHTLAERGPCPGARECVVVACLCHDTNCGTPTRVHTIYTQDGDGVISRLEFVTRILVKLRRCTDEDIREISKVFDSLDTDGSGSLSNEDIDYDELRKKLKHLPSSAAINLKPS